MDSNKIKSKLIDELRNNIDGIDTKIISLLSNRLEKSRQIIKIKNELGEAVYSPERERQILNSLFLKSSRIINRKFIEELYTLIFNEAKNISVKKPNPFSLSLLLNDSNAVNKFNNLPPFIANEFNFVLCFKDINLIGDLKALGKENIKIMYLADSYIELNTTTYYIDYVVPNYFHNFCDEIQRKYANFANSNNSIIVIKYDNGFYAKEFYEALDRYIAILNEPPSILVGENSRHRTDYVSEINLNSLVELKSNFSATIFKDLCYLNKEKNIVAIAKAAYTTRANSVLIDIHSITISSLQSIIDFCTMLNKIQ